MRERIVLAGTALLLSVAVACSTPTPSMADVANVAAGGPHPAGVALHRARGE